MNVDKDLKQFFADEPPGEKTNAIRWLQKQVMRAAVKLPRDFKTLLEWEAFKAQMRRDLPRVIGIPAFPPLRESTVRGRIVVGGNVICERVDVYVDDDYAIPAFVFSPAESQGGGSPSRRPGVAQGETILDPGEHRMRM